TTPTTCASGYAAAATRRRSPPAGPASATRPPSTAGPPRGGSASKKSRGRRGAPRPDRRERLLPQPAGAAQLGPGGPDAGAGGLGRAPGQGVGHRRPLGVAGGQAAGAVLRHRPGGLPRLRGGGRLPARAAAAPARPGDRGLGQRQQPQGPGDPRRPAKLRAAACGVAAGVRARGEPGGGLVVVPEVRQVGELRAGGCLPPGGRGRGPSDRYQVGGGVVGGPMARLRLTVANQTITTFGSITVRLGDGTTQVIQSPVINTVPGAIGI